MHDLNGCREGLPNERTGWQTVEPLIATAIRNWLAEAHIQKLIDMEANEDEITSDLKDHIRTEMATTFGGEIWDVGHNHNKVLAGKKSKKQPTQYLREAVDSFIAIRDGQSCDFGMYLSNFSMNDFERAKEHFWRKARTVDNEEMLKNLTKPDIIVHELTCNQVVHNLIAIETKPPWSRRNYLSLVDLARVKVYTTDKVPGDRQIMATYQFGLFLHFTKTGLQSGWRFENGKDEAVPLLIDETVAD